MAEARKLMLEAKDLIMNKDNATAMSFMLSQSSPYAQVQWLILEDYMKDAVVAINTCLHINDTGDNSIKKVIDETAHEQGILVKDLVRKILIEKTLEGILRL